jgi:hypothetical protein
MHLMSSAVVQELAADRLNDMITEATDARRARQARRTRKLRTPAQQRLAVPPPTRTDSERVPVTTTVDTDAALARTGASETGHEDRERVLVESGHTRKS